MSKLTSFYENLIKLCGVKIGDYGRLAVPFDPDIYLQYDERFIVFPEKQYLTSPDNPPEKTITFHPLSESSIRGASEVQDVLRRAAIVYLNAIGRSLLSKAIEINRNITADSSFKPNHKLSKLFANIGDIDEKFMKFWIKVDNKMSEDPKCRLFDIYLKQHGEVDNKRFDRICTISSPLYDALIFNNDMKVFGVTAERKKDLNTLKEVLKTLFPRLDTGGYVNGSSENVAPFLNVFIDGLIEIETRFNEVLLAYGKEANDTEGLYCKGLDIKRDVDIANIRNMLPADKAYNVGMTKEQEAEGIANPNQPRRKPAAAPEPEVRAPRGLVENVQRKPVETEQPTSTATTSTAPANKPFWMTEESDNRRGRYDDRDSRGGRDYDERDRGYDDRRDSRGRDRGYDDRGRGRDDRYGRGYDDRGRDRGYSDRGRGGYDSRDRGRDRGGYDDRRDSRRDSRDGGWSTGSDKPFWA